MRTFRNLAVISTLTLATLAPFHPTALANGTETLGSPSVSLAPGTGIIGAGVGLFASQPQTLTINVPSGVTIRQVLLYWEGQSIAPAGGDATIVVNGTTITGTLIGGPTPFFDSGSGTVQSSSFRADITSSNLVHAGANSLTIQGLDFGFANDGAGLLVIVDDGGPRSDIQVRDGNDLAYFAFAPPLDTTAPQTFTFSASSTARTATLLLQTGSVRAPNRPNSIEVTVGSAAPTVYSDRLGSMQGPEWDVLSLPITIPAGVTTVKVQLLSRDDHATGFQNASMAWVSAALSVPPSGGSQGGSDGLSAPSIPIASGTGIVGTGTGLVLSQPQALSVSVPSTAVVKQVLLYWEGMSISPSGGDSTIVVNGVSVNGTRIGGPTSFFPSGSGTVASSAFRADITSRNLIRPGSNTLTVGGLNSGFANDGAGLLVIFDDRSGASNIQVRDGDDLVFRDFAPPLDATVPQTFTFPSTASSRTATLILYVGSVTGPASGSGSHRPNSIEVRVGSGAPTRYSDALTSAQGPEWDTLKLSVPIPAGATSLTVQLFSRDDRGSGDLPASMAWVAAALSVPAGATAGCSGVIGDFVWKDLNENGIQDAGEPGLGGIKLKLKNGSGTTVATTTTSAQGAYTFTGLCAGSYTVVVDPTSLPEDAVPSPCSAGGTAATDNNCSPAPVTLPSGDAVDRTIDFGYRIRGDEGCSLGFWKNHEGRWSRTGYSPTQTVASVFSAASAYPSLGSASLRSALRFQGGPSVQAAAALLLKQSVASLLNASHPGIEFPLAPADVVRKTNDAIQTGRRGAILDLAGRFDGLNDGSCPMDDNGGDDHDDDHSSD